MMKQVRYNLMSLLEGNHFKSQIIFQKIILLDQKKPYFIL